MNKKKMNVKNLVIIRHAKSSWNEPFLEDHNRTLNQRGQINAPLMGERLKNLELGIKAVFSSTAIRALTTAEIICQKINFPQDKIIKEPSLYLAPVSKWLELIEQLDENINSVMLFGHNPGITNLANKVWGLPINNIPTCGTLHLVFQNITWKKTASSKPDEANFDFPKNKSDTALSLL